MFRYTVLAALCAVASSASAGELTALQGGTVDLGSFHGVVYYTQADDGYRVVTTMTAGEQSSPVRFVATLTEGQAFVISVPGESEGLSQALEISRAEGKLVVAKVESTQ
jgi:ABC-type nitrate/sulfonate/bicarbonate transport system substrate-binding protein